MNPHKNSSTEPEHLVRVQKRCPRLDCPKPTIGIAWRGSVKQLQYHCYGCWRKFNYGGVLRSWAKQVCPPNWWLRRHAQGVKKAPKLLDLQPPIASRSGPCQKRTHRRPSRRSVANSSATEDDNTNAVQAAESSQKRTKATVNHVINKEVTAIATSGEDGIAGSSTLPSVDVITKLNGLGDEEALHCPGTRGRASPTSDITSGMMNDLDDLFGEAGNQTPVWQSFMSPQPHVLWDDEVQDGGAGIISAAAPVAANDNNPIVHGVSAMVAANNNNPIVQGVSIAATVAANENNPIVQGTSGLTNAQSGDVAQPRRRALTIKFRGFSKTIYYGHQN